MWPRNKRHPTPAPSAVDRLQEAEEALASTERIKKDASSQVSFFQELREGWARVHERNNLAHLFEAEYRRIHHD